MTAVGVVLAVAIAALPFRQADIQQCVVAVDIGHSKSQPGAVSARGVSEYTFNRNIARLLLAEVHKRGMKGSFIVETPSDRRLLGDRTKAAERRGADFFISIHHDSVQPSYLTTWKYEGVERRYSDRFSGFSLFVSNEGRNAVANVALARSIGTQLLNAGLHASLHHAEKIKGEGRELIGREQGIYAFDDLIVLKTATMPAVLLECGVIVNRDEELRLQNRAYQDRLVSAVATGIMQQCAADSRKTP